MTPSAISSNVRPNAVAKGGYMPLYDVTPDLAGAEDDDDDDDDIVWGWAGQEGQTHEWRAEQSTEAACLRRRETAAGTRRPHSHTGKAPTRTQPNEGGGRGGVAEERG